jgi:hypothetical protein
MDNVYSFIRKKDDKEIEIKIDEISKEGHIGRSDGNKVGVSGKQDLENFLHALNRVEEGLETDFKRTDGRIASVYKDKDGNIVVEGSTQDSGFHLSNDDLKEMRNNLRKAIKPEY